VIEQASPQASVRSAAIEAAAQGFRGAIEQRAPAYSAIKQGGEALYKKVRRGEAVEPPVRSVTIHDLTWRDRRRGGHDRVQRHVLVGHLRAQPRRRLRKGARPRRVAALLRRTAIGPHGVRARCRPRTCSTARWARSPSGTSASREAGLTPEQALAHLPSFALDRPEAARLAQGQAPVAGDLRHAGLPTTRSSCG
jgi:tRNA pseudouridine55 synthase